MKSRYSRNNKSSRLRTRTRSRSRSRSRTKSSNNRTKRTRSRTKSRSRSRSRSNKNKLRLRKIRKRLRGGNANTLPLEYFGGDSKRYHLDQFVNKGNHEVYGEYTPQSFGEPFDNSSNGPNLFVHPNSSGKQTDGPN